MRVLVAEDEIRMAVLLKRALEEESHAVDVAADGPQGLWMATENAYGRSSWMSCCPAMRSSGSGGPIPAALAATEAQAWGSPSSRPSPWRMAG
jgi:CheY-like chemotaxis protein